jgi:hypothetical protein
MQRRVGKGGDGDFVETLTRVLASEMLGRETEGPVQSRAFTQRDDLLALVPHLRLRLRPVETEAAVEHSVEFEA